MGNSKKMLKIIEIITVQLNHCRLLRAGDTRRTKFIPLFCFPHHYSKVFTIKERRNKKIKEIKKEVNQTFQSL